MKKRALVWGIAPVVVGVALAQMAHAAIIVKIGLVGSAANPAATGGARFRDRAGKMDLNVEVIAPGIPKGTTLNVFLGGVSVGNIVLINRGGVPNGALIVVPPTLPASVTGLSVEVKTADGTLVASGTF